MTKKNEPRSRYSEIRLMSPIREAKELSNYSLHDFGSTSSIKAKGNIYNVDSISIQKLDVAVYNKGLGFSMY